MIPTVIILAMCSYAATVTASGEAELRASSKFLPRRLDSVNKEDAKYKRNGDEVADDNDIKHDNLTARSFTVTSLPELPEVDPSASTLTVKNNCEFTVIALYANIFDAPKAQRIIPSGQKVTFATDAGGMRLYWQPDGADCSAEKQAGVCQTLGYAEPNCGASGCSIGNMFHSSPNGGIGLPVKYSCGNKADTSGCEGSSYAGFDNMQQAIEDFCPTQSIDVGQVKACKDPAGFDNGCQWNPAGLQDTTWATSFDVSAACQASGVPEDLVQQVADQFNTNPKCAIANSFGHCFNPSVPITCDQVAAISRGISLADEEHGGDMNGFYPGYDYKKQGAKWPFNPWAAYIHALCGPTGGFGFGADDHFGPTGSSPGGAGVVNNCEQTTVELCPGAR
jgi:hypothetical protein